MDLEKFFDRVNHDVLMGRLAKRIADKRVLGLIRRYLEAGIMADGVVMERHEGTPQGGPLSPLLANVLLDEVDKELEKRGHAFVRYADDCNVYVRSQASGRASDGALRRLYARLRLRVNEAKSAVARAWERKFLGYSFWVAAGRRSERRVAPEGPRGDEGPGPASITRRNGGRSLTQVVAGAAELPARAGRTTSGWPRRPASSATSTSGSATGCERCSSSSGSEGRRSTASCAPGSVRIDVAARSRPTRAAGGRTRAHGASTSPCPTRYFDELGVPRLAA